MAGCGNRPDRPFFDGPGLLISTKSVRNQHTTHGGGSWPQQNQPRTKPRGLSVSRRRASACDLGMEWLPWAWGLSAIGRSRLVLGLVLPELSLMVSACTWRRAHGPGRRLNKLVECSKCCPLCRLDEAGNGGWRLRRIFAAGRSPSAPASGFRYGRYAIGVSSRLQEAASVPAACAR